MQFQSFILLVICDDCDLQYFQGDIPELKELVEKLLTSRSCLGYLDLR